MPSLEAEFEFYLAHQEELVKLYNGKYVVIKQGQVLGSYENHLDAIRITAQDHKLGTFLVQKCSPGPGDYTVCY